MKRFERILICIDRPERDAAMLAYVHAIARYAESKEVHILHAAQNVGGASDEVPGGVAAQVEVDVETLRAIAAEHFKDLPKLTCLCEVIKGAPLVETLRFAYEKNIDLIVIGRHCGDVDDANGEAVLARRITRKATCSVLVLPEARRIKADTILAPVRDSECSANALDVGCAIAGATGGKVVALNVYHVHTGYSRIGMTLEEHEAALGTAADHELSRLLGRVVTRGVTVERKSMPDHRGRPVPIILEAIAEASADLVVIGARGRTGAAGVLLGAVTERLIHESPVPVLAVKKKGECLGILRALLALVTEG